MDDPDALPFAMVEEEKELMADDPDVFNDNYVRSLSAPEISYGWSNL